MVTTTMSLPLTLYFFILFVSTVTVAWPLKSLSSVVKNGGVWCVANNKASDAQLQANIYRLVLQRRRRLSRLLSDPTRWSLL
ncbi:unnamed protein product [Cochlearia groenlandica]